MARQIIDVGLAPDDGTGDGVRTVCIKINAMMAELYTRMSVLRARDVVITSSTTPITLVEGAVRTLVLAAADRDVFNPGSFAVLTRASTPDCYAVVQPSTFDALTGAFSFTILTAFGGPGPFNDWEVAALAGSTLAQIALLDEGRDERTAAEAARSLAQNWATKPSGEVVPGEGFSSKKHAQDAGSAATIAVTAAGTATTKAAEAAAYAASIAGGPVTSVNTKTGIVTLTADDVGAYSKTEVDGKITALKGTADVANDTLGELQARIDAATAAIALLADNPSGAGSPGGPNMMI